MVLLVILLAMLLFIGCVYAIYSMAWLVKKRKENARFIQQYGMTKEEYIVAKKAKEREEHERKRQERIEKKNSFFKSLSDQYGKCSASFSFAISSHANKVFEAHVFEDKNMIVVFNSDLFEITNTIPFQSILDFSIDVDIKRIGGNTATTTTKTSTGSMVKRGLVGGVLFGGVGALAGAATAKTTSQTTFDEEKEECRYSISINLDSISSPIYIMYFGLGSTTCKKVAGILTTIIRRNN